jgi:hypothetical protein
LDLAITLAGDKSHRVLLGDDTPTGGAAYAALAGDPRVFTVASYVKSSFDKNLDDFRSKKLFDFEYNDPAKIEFHDGSKSYFLTRSDHEWWGPDGKKLDAAGAGLLVDKLRDLTALKFDESGFAAPTIQVTVSLESSGNTEKVFIAKAKSNYLAKRENNSTLYELDSKAVEELRRAAAELKPKTAK